MPKLHSPEQFWESVSVSKINIAFFKAKKESSTKILEIKLKGLNED